MPYILYAGPVTLENPESAFETEMTNKSVKGEKMLIASGKIVVTYKYLLEILYILTGKKINSTNIQYAAQLILETARRFEISPNSVSAKSMVKSKKRTEKAANKDDRLKIKALKFLFFLNRLENESIMEMETAV